MIQRMGKWVAVGAAALLLAGTSAAQVGPFGGGGFGKAGLLANPDVQKELKLTEEQTTKLREITQQIREKNKEAFGKLKDLPDDQRREKFQELAKSMGAETDKALKDVLKPEQATRLKQLDLQQRGADAFGDPEVQKEIKLTDEQKEKIKTITQDAQKEMREIFQNAKDKGNFQEAITKIGPLRKDTLEKVTALLNSDQKKTWKGMTGEPFEFRIRRPGDKDK